MCFLLSVSVATADAEVAAPLVGPPTSSSFSCCFYLITSSPADSPDLTVLIRTWTVQQLQQLKLKLTKRPLVVALRTEEEEQQLN